MVYRFVIICLCFSLSLNLGWSHPGHKPKKARPDSLHHDSSTVHEHKAMLDHPMPNAASVADPSTALMPVPLTDFPTYHPMVVHIPIVLLILAALLQLVALVRPSGPVNWLTLLVAVLGTTGAYIAGSLVHPHTDGLSDAAQLVLETHETYADYTLWLGFVGTVLKSVTLWRKNKWLEGLTAVTFVCAGIAVGLASHQGGALTYLYGIGPRGAYLEQHEAGHADGDRHEHEHPDPRK